MSNLNPYLIFNGNAADVIEFYKKTLGATVEYMQNYETAPMPVEESWKQKILHASLLINNATVMVADSSPEHKMQFGDNVSLALNFEKDTDIENKFSALAEGGKVKMPLQKTFWATKFGMLEDKFGIHWMFNHD